MKKNHVLFLLLFLIIVLLFSCNLNPTDDDDDSRTFDDWEELTLNVHPDPVFMHAMASNGDKVILFGGGNDADDSSWETFAETWEFDVTAAVWSKISTSGSAPMGRLWHSMACNTDNKVVMFGGWSEITEILSDTWIFDIDLQTWTNVSDESSERPSKRYRHSMVYIGNNKFIMFGGWLAEPVGGNPYSDETWEYDLNTKQWTNLTSLSETRPTPRHFAPMIYCDVTDKVYVFGGTMYSPSDNELPLNDTWEFDVNTHVWTQIETTGNDNQPISGSIAKIDESKFIILQGNIGKKFTTTAKTWEVLGQCEQLENRQLWSSEMVSISNNRLLLFGGRGGVYPDTMPLGDTWIYSTE
jgi:N-acetylneuraminic acid mutarotase